MGTLRLTFSIIFVSCVCLGVVAGCSRDRSEAVRVNGESITYREYRTACENKLKITGGKELSADERREIIDGLIERELLRQGAVKAGIAASAKEIEERIDEVKKRLGEKGFSDFLSREGMSPAEFRKHIEKEVLFDRFRDSVTKDISVDKQETEDYYHRHAADFRIPTLYRVYIIKSFGEGEAEDMLRRFRQKSEDFDRWALGRSPEDIRSINVSARLTPEGEFPDDMLADLRRMKPGDIGGPIRKKSGYFLYKLIEKQDEKQKSLGEAITEIRHLILEEKKEARIQDYVRTAKATAKVDIRVKK